MKLLHKYTIDIYDTRIIGHRDGELNIYSTSGNDTAQFLDQIYRDLPGANDMTLESNLKFLRESK